MGELKTRANDRSVDKFIATILDEDKKSDSVRLVELFSSQTGEKPVMWGDSIIGFGQYHYKSDRSRQEGDWMLTGFSPRKQTFSIYIMNGFDSYGELLDNLGKHKTSVGCLYIKKLEDIDIHILGRIIQQSYLNMKNTYN